MRSLPGSAADRGIHGRGEIEDQARGIVGGERCGEVGGDAADEEASGIFVEGDGTAEKAGQDRTERGDRNQAAIVFDQEFSAEIGVAALNAGVGLVDLKVAFDVVVAQAPASRRRTWR